MELWFIIGILVLIIFALGIKIKLIHKAAEEIQNSFRDRLTADTNTLIDISSGDKYIRRLASSINRELISLRSQRHRYMHGDTELKNAVTSISHDLRTPLTVIYGYLDLLEREEQTETSRRWAEIIRNRTDALKALTDELFRYSIITAANDDMVMEQVIINQVLEESIAAFYAVLKEHLITPLIQITDRKIIRQLDRASLSRIFSNLLSNAVKYSQGDLHIVLSETGEILFSNLAPGLSSVETGKLFDRFYTVDSAKNSTGLGLTIARTLTEQMRGAIWAGYENGRLTIHVLFPEADIDASS